MSSKDSIHTLLSMNTLATIVFKFKLQKIRKNSENHITSSS